MHIGYIPDRTATPRKTYDRCRPCSHGSIETARSGCSDGISPFVYGHARSREDDNDDDYKLCARMSREARKDKE